MFWNKEFFRLKIFSEQRLLQTNKFLGPKYFQIQNFFRNKIFSDPKYFWTQNFWDLKFFQTQNLFGPTIFFRLKIVFYVTDIAAGIYV